MWRLTSEWINSQEHWTDNQNANHWPGVPGIVCTDCCATECWLERLLDGEPHRVPRPPPLLGAGHPRPQLAVGDLRQKWALTGDFIYIYFMSSIFCPDKFWQPKESSHQLVRWICQAAKLQDVWQQHPLQVTHLKKGDTKFSHYYSRGLGAFIISSFFLISFGNPSKKVENSTLSKIKKI